MKHVICLAVASLLATSANAAEMKWSGSAGYRYEQTSVDRINGENNNKAHGFRANLGVSGGWENVEWGVGVRTQRNTANGAMANDDHVFAANANDFGVGFEQAWFRYVREIGSLDLAATVGRQKNVFAYDSVSQNLFDNDVRFDGLGWQFKFGMFGINAAQYVIGSSNTTNGALPGVSNHTTPSGSRFGYLLGIQPTMNWKFSDEIEAMFGVGYYYWKNTTETNTVGGSDIGLAAATPPTGGFNVVDPRQWQFTAAVSLPYALSFNGEFVMNRSQVLNNNGAAIAGSPDVSRSAWSAGLTYGSLKKAHDFSVGYAYGSKGIGAVANQFTHEKFQADNKGHTIRASYALADNFHVGARAILLNKKEEIATGISPVSANANKSSYWEITGGVMF